LTEGRGGGGVFEGNDNSAVVRASKQRGRGEEKERWGKPRPRKKRKEETHSSKEVDVKCTSF